MQTCGTKIVAYIQVQHIGRGVGKEFFKVEGRISGLAMVMEDCEHAVLFGNGPQPFTSLVPDFVAHTFGSQ